MSKLDEFINHLTWHAGKSIYVWGGQGEALKDLTEQKIRNMETSTSYANTAIEMWNKRKGIDGARAFDCSGLGCYLMECVGAVGKGFDTTADGLMDSCKKINKSDLKKGDFVFKVSGGKAVHIGYVVDNSLNVVEAQGRAYGVVNRPLSSVGWNAYGRPEKFFPETKTTNSSSLWVLSRLLKQGIEGNDVKEAQRRLNNSGYNLDVDGIFGSKTKAATKDFQTKNNLTSDGIIGEKTCRALGGIWE